MDAVINLRHEPKLREAFEYAHVHNNTVLIDRRTKWGNPFRIGRDGSREEVIARYRADLWRRIRAGEIALEELAEIAGCWYACWCHCPARCWRCRPVLRTRADECSERRARHDRHAFRRIAGNRASPAETVGSLSPGRHPEAGALLHGLDEDWRGCACMSIRASASDGASSASVLGVTIRVDFILQSAARSLRSGSRAMPSARALRSNLRFAPISSAIPIASASKLAARSACRQSGTVSASIERKCLAQPPKGAVPGTNKYSSDVMDHCATRAHCANPAAGGVLHSAALRCGRDSE